MVYNYQRKTTRQQWSQNSMREALQKVREGALIRPTAQAYSLPYTTLHRYYRRYQNGDFPENAGRFKKTFTTEQTNTLRNYVSAMDSRGFGVSRKQFRKLAYDFAEKEGTDHPFNYTKKAAGKDFAQSFARETSLTLRKPEATSVARLTGFTKARVAEFFDICRNIREDFSFQAHQIYNMDETGMPTVPTKIPKVFSEIGKRKVYKATSAERGTTVTAVCCASATGNYVPPMLLFPRKKMQPGFLDGTPYGSVAIANGSGWMDGITFVKWISHFVYHTLPSRENPILLYLDGHGSHITLSAIEEFQKHHVTVIALPSHCTHKMQPLDVSFFGPLKTAYSHIASDFLAANNGLPIKIQDVPKLFGRAYSTAATIHNAVQGFKATGIEPLNSKIFPEEEFQAVGYTERTTDEEPGDNVSSSSSLPPMPQIGSNQKRVQKRRLPSLHITGEVMRQMLEDKARVKKEMLKRKK